MKKKQETRETTEQASLPELKLEALRVKITGNTPLITNRFSEAKMEAMQAAQAKAAKMTKAPRDPEREFKDAIHPYPTKDKNVHGGFPAIAVKKAIVRAGTFADEKMTKLRGAIQVMGDMLPISGSAPIMRSDRVVLASGTTSIAYRPMFETWTLPIDLQFNSNAITRDQVLNLIRIAGFSVGIGCWRPETDGTFGQFDIAEVEAIKLTRQKS